MKNTIKWFGVIALVAVIGFSMTACDTGDDDIADGLDSKLVGTWVENSDYNWHFGTPTYTFGRDGKFNNNENMSWSTSGGVITLTSSTGYGFTYTAKYRISGKTLTISESSNVTVLFEGTYTKQ